MGNVNTANLLNRLCSEFQSVWIVDTDEFLMDAYKIDKGTANLFSLNAIKTMNRYPEIRDWYIDNCIASYDRDRVKQKTTIENIISKIRDGKTFCIDYNRINGTVTNYNQLYFAKYESDEEELKHFILGFRNIDVVRRTELDELTGVYNRFAFFQKAEQLLRDYPDKQFDLMLSDIVDFKIINETYSVAVGDEVLRMGGDYINSISANDSIVGRYGGDQFALIGPHDFIQNIISNNSMINVADMLEQQGLPRATVKFGIYENINHSKSIISTCDKAHLALNTIKHQYGRYVAYYDDSLRHSIDIERKIEDSMHEALNNNQFKVFYQPKHNTSTGELIGAEALIRWVHPEYGFMSPADFIPLFERNGFIVESDYYVWKRTCENLNRWKSAGLNVVPVSVNASKLTFAQNNLLDYLQDITQDNNVDTSLLHLEITETLMTDNLDSLIEKLDDIKSQGFQIELDDFGSGYSSINLLSALPLDVVKLDMSFMRQFGDSKRSKVLASCINLAKDLGYKTISEGVELKEQSDLLSALGVDAIQGYYYSKPLSEDDFEKYMLEHGL